MSTPRRIGTWLVDAGLISADQLDSALAQQRAQGGPLGRHLVLDGSLSRLQLYRALATQWEVPLVDLVAQPPEPGLLQDTDLTAAADEGWLPWRRQGEVLVIATSTEPTPELLARVARRHGASRVDVVATTDWDVTQAVQAQFRDHLLHRSAEEFASNHAERSAKYGLVTWQRALPVAAVALLAVGLVIDVQVTTIIAFAVANVAFSINVLFKVVTALRAPSVAHAAARRHRALAESRAAQGELSTWGVAEEDLPVYTVLVPAFREANVIGQVMENVGSLDYPTSKLDVLVLLEEDDAETIAAAKASAPPEYVRILVVPRGAPQTKPRACNYGLAFARGRYCVIFDAEDRPDPDQLRVAVEAFRRDDVERAHGIAPDRPLVCVQAALNYFNADYNVL
ncbi:MAG: glycosyltransferase, partial [Cellulomonas sp.]|nr:glycosyltransferase [Cellulomonas sp.]